MYVRWKKRKSTARLWKGDITYSAELVENKRVDGKPRQHVLAFLHSIRESEVSQVSSRYYFWERIVTQLHTYGYLLDNATEQRQAIVQGLAKVVPLLTGLEVSQMEARTRHVLGDTTIPSWMIASDLPA